MYYKKSIVEVMSPQAMPELIRHTLLSLSFNIVIILIVIIILIIIIIIIVIIIIIIIISISLLSDQYYHISFHSSSTFSSSLLFIRYIKIGIHPFA